MPLPAESVGSPPLNTGCFGTMNFTHCSLSSVLTSLLLLALVSPAINAQESPPAPPGAQPTAEVSVEVVSIGVQPVEGEQTVASSLVDDSDEVHFRNDPTHANVSDQTYKVIDWRTDLALFTAVVFGLLLVVLGSAAWKPIAQGLERRERGIADNISRAEKAAAEATAKLAEYESKLAAAAEESQRIVTEARKDAEAAGQKLIAAAQEEAAQSRERALAEIETAKRVALNELAAQSTDVAMSLAQRVVGREVRSEDHQGMIQEMLDKLPSLN